MTELRRTFDDVAELYDSARPGYPAAVFDDLARYVSAGARVLEIGCGTGQATAELLGRGYDVTCIELGTKLAGVARRKLGDAVTIVNADFETWYPTARFDAVVAFTSFHWLDPSLRFRRCAEAADTLAVVETTHVMPPNGDRFFVEVQADYEALTDDAAVPPSPDDVGDLRAEIDASGLFATEAVHRHLWDVAYTADDYVAVLKTYSGHLALDEETRALLLGRIRDRIGSGTIRKTYLATLNVARRR